MSFLLIVPIVYVANKLSDASVSAINYVWSKADNAKDTVTNKLYNGAV